MRKSGTTTRKRNTLKRVLHTRKENTGKVKGIPKAMTTWTLIMTCMAKRSMILKTVIRGIRFLGRNTSSLMMRRKRILMIATLLIVKKIQKRMNWWKNTK